MDGVDPLGALIQTTEGIFYGSTFGGGTASPNGTVFRLDANGTFTTFHLFNGHDGTGPEGALLHSTDGNYYGVTTAGGLYGYPNDYGGTLFQIIPDGTFTTLHNFTYLDASTVAASDRDYPNGSLIQAADGNIYGTTRFDGGTVFRVTPAGTFSTLAILNGGDSDNGAIGAGLIQGADGSLYGTTSAGTATGAYGKVFRMTLSGTVTTLYRFTGGSDGSNPKSGIIQGDDGNFYGATLVGGSNNYGTIFKLTPGGVLTTLHNFNKGNGDAYGYVNGLIEGEDGNFYGSTVEGGTHDEGTLFRVTPGGDFTILFSFNISTDGYGPTAPLTQGADGNLYGVCEAGLIYRLDTNFPAVSVPVITSSPNATGQVGSPFIYQTTALNSPTSFGAGDLPPGINFDPSTGILSGTPTQTGTFLSSISASNPGGISRTTLTAVISAKTDPTPTPTPTVTPAPTPTASPTPTPTPRPTSSPTPTPGPTSTPTPTSTPAPTPTPTATPTPKPIATPTVTPTPTPIQVLPTVTIVAKTTKLAENGPKDKIIVARSGDTSSDLTVSYSAKGSAEAGVNYKKLTGAVVIPAGSASTAIKLKPVDDGVADGTLVLKVTLLPSDSYTVGSPGKAKIKILNVN